MIGESQGWRNLIALRNIVKLFFILKSILEEYSRTGCNRLIEKKKSAFFHLAGRTLLNTMFVDLKMTSY